jgi:hypothetical protein
MPLTAAGASVIGSIASAASAAGTAAANSANNRRSYKWTRKLNQEQNKFNAEQAQIAYDRQREFYDYSFNKEFENEKYWADYNSPLQQMQRYKAAGLNPALLAGQFDSGNVAAGASGTSDSPQASAAGLSQFSTTPAFQGADFSSIVGLLGLSSTMDVNKSIADKNRVEAAKTAGVDTDKVVQDIKESQSRVENINSDTHLKDSQKKLVENQARESLYNIEHLLPAELKKKFSEIQKNLSDMRNSQTLTRSQVAKFAQDIRESISRVNLNQSTKSKIDTELDWMDRNFSIDMSIKHQQFQQLKSQNEILKIRNGILDSIDIWDGYKVERSLIQLKLLNFLNGIAF